MDGGALDWEVEVKALQNNQNAKQSKESAKQVQNKKLSYRRETARQLPTWRGG